MTFVFQKGDPEHCESSFIKDEPGLFAEFPSKESLEATNQPFTESHIAPENIFKSLTRHETLNLTNRNIGCSSIAIHQYGQQDDSTYLFPSIKNKSKFKNKNNLKCGQSIANLRNQKIKTMKRKMVTGSKFSKDFPQSCVTKTDFARMLMLENSFQCEFCSKRFMFKSHLTIHERVHTSERPFQCKLCSKRFNHKSSLTRHRVIHSVERPFRCKFCSKAFKQNIYLKSHEENIHNQGNF